MTFTEHPRLLARIAGALYLIITGCALFAYLYVRGQVIVADDMAQTAANFLGRSSSIDSALRPPSSSSSAICPWGLSSSSCSRW
jgi:hypothetical protein